MQSKAEIYLGAYEALHHILKSLVFMPSPSALGLLTRSYNLLDPEAQVKVKPHIDYFVEIYLENINNLIEAGYLARARRAILIDWKVSIYSIKSLFSSCDLLLVLDLAVRVFMSFSRVRHEFDITRIHIEK